MGASENRGTLFGGPYNKDPTIWGTILGSPILGTPPYVIWVECWGLGFAETLRFQSLRSCLTPSCPVQADSLRYLNPRDPNPPSRNPKILSLRQPRSPQAQIS